MKHLKYLLVAIIPILLAGCWDSQENERMLYVYGVGIDYIENEYRIYVQVVSFGNTAKTEQINQDLMQSEVGYSTGKTVNDAFANLYNSVDERLFLGHLTTLIFSEDLLKSGNMNEILNSFTRYIDTRYQTWIYATDKPIEEFFLETPILKKSITLTKLANPLNTYEQNSFIEPVNIRKLIIQLNEPNHLAKIPYITIKEVWNTEKGFDPAFVIEGVALITPKEFKGYLLKDDAKGLQYLTGETITTYLTTSIDGHDFTFVNRNLRLKITPITKGNNAKFQIEVSVTSTLRSFDLNLSHKDLEKQIEEEIKKEILRTYKKGLELNSDVYRLSEILYRKKLKLWKNTEKDGRIPLSEDSIDVHVTVDKLKSGRSMFKDTLKEYP